jgi:3-methyl-2-oxobutanoate hydroxymethyltransferase
MNEQIRRKTVRDIQALKDRGEPVVCLTAYTKPVARLADAHADLVLVGDSMGMVLYGFDSTIPVTLDMMIAHGAAVGRSTQRALVVVDMPFGTYQESPAQAFHNAAQIMKQTGCQAVKLEGGVEMAETVAFLTSRGIPVMGHIGLQPQSVQTAGGYRATGMKEAERSRLKKDAEAVAGAGAFAIVLECMEESLAAAISKACPVPTIGIGASAACDGQVLVSEDLLGFTGGPLPRFVKPYADLAATADSTFSAYAAEVRGRIYPDERHVYRARQRRKTLAGQKISLI